MKQMCKGCFKPNIPDYCGPCRRKLFDNGRIDSILPFSLPERSQLDVLSTYNKERTLKSIRIEYAVQQNGNNLELSEERGSHILKPVSTGIFQRLEQMPSNEHLTMQIAEQVYKIPMAPCAIAFLEGGSTCYLTRRFDISESKVFTKKYSLPELFERAPDLIYNTIEDIAALLKKYLAAYKPQIEHLFSITVFNYLFSNHGEALNHFSLVKTAEEEYILSPAYNLLCTELHESKREDILYNDQYAGAFLREGGYTYADFYTLALKIGIVPIRAERILNIFCEKELRVDYLISQSFLSDESKSVYSELYHSKLARLRQR